MSTGPGPTRKADGTSDASVDDIADLLVEGEAASEDAPSEERSEDSLEVMLETPGPVLANPFMPPPPSPTELARHRPLKARRFSNIYRRRRFPTTLFPTGL